MLRWGEAKKRPLQTCPKEGRLVNLSSTSVNLSRGVFLLFNLDWYSIAVRSIWEQFEKVQSGSCSSDWNCAEIARSKGIRNLSAILQLQSDYNLKNSCDTLVTSWAGCTNLSFLHQNRWCFDRYRGFRPPYCHFWRNFDEIRNISPVLHLCDRYFSDCNILVKLRSDCSQIAVTGTEPRFENNLNCALLKNSDCPQIA